MFMAISDIKFAHFMAYLGYLRGQGGTFHHHETSDVYVMITDMMAEQKPDYVYNHGLLIEMLTAMKSDRRIDAIKAHRAMSGFGLKESKEFIEMHWMAQAPKQMPETANLGRHSQHKATGESK